jgi:hypothetical protein
MADCWGIILTTYCFFASFFMPWGLRAALFPGRKVRYNPNMNAICLVIDRLHLGCLGAYGNSWIQTPSLDRLASQSIVFDQAMIDSPQLEILYRSYWQGWHAFCPTMPVDPQRSLAKLIGEAGVMTTLFSDVPQMARYPMAADFDALVEIEPAWQASTAEDVEQTHLARCFMQIIQQMESSKGQNLWWCHLGSLGTTWDAPWSFREAYAEEDDPPPPTSADVPDQIMAADCDPDELLGMVQSYAGQVTLLDTCLGALLEYLDGTPVGNETLLVLVSPRGFPLGEHRRVGTADDALFSELVHVPWMMRFPEAQAAGMRSQALIEPSDLWATLLDWWKISPPPSPTAASLLPLVREESFVPRELLGIRGADTERAIRTPAWYLRIAKEPELFAKPDDRWEVNDVSQRCREVCDSLQDTLTQYELTLPSGRIADLPPLDDVLLHGLE